ncbi:protein-L-isoaspartate O-methyltransferase [Methylobacterium gregans]|uniref:Protein-L-isoaspartate O-methyltransferase n=1 Tax=Methylobacterium gregans TaxID=374424 RepID=A0AA37HKE2_9HYPH|nr:protein-L-isoaspartate(D-aspartate) O-methyltransferase [Methylobacterium gregans]GJD77322.1 Protein-L-isoaspartate O-methyltransferase [Methylobacterium gregans]GLS56357.1 protein-L-isoaspartate O-methyltransferase [Methylobacterium gregans]
MDIESDAGLADGPAEEAVGNAAFVLALLGRGLRDRAVLRAMERVPRARFAMPEHADLARRDLALPLPCGAAMTAPGTVARMLALLRVEPGQRVLEVGTGSGYVTALLAELGAAVTSLERYATLAEAARGRISPDAPVTVLHADGLAEAGEGTYDRVMVNGAVGALNPGWIAALAPAGRLVAGLGTPGGCRLTLYRHAPEGCETGPSVRLAGLVPGRALAL